MASSSTSYDAYREKKLGLRHKIFLSYSGADQVFLWELYDDLVEHKYHPFFDHKSLPKAAPVSMGNIVEEAADSDLAVFFLSEAFFTRNQNPMMELVECVKNNVRLLPLFYEISVDTIKKSMESWYNGPWSKWEVDLNGFKKALETLLHMSGIENKEGWRPRQFRRRVIEEIQKIVHPDIRPDVSDICGGDRLIKVVKDMFDKMAHHESTQAPAIILGLYGPSGTGKSTLCKMLEHSESSVCYIQLDSCLDEKAKLERMKKVLRSLTNLSTDLIDKLTKPDEAQKKLLEQEYEKKVFMIIDNVILPGSLKEARIYLDGGCRRFKNGSKILITAHTEDVLAGLADMGGKWHIAAMPDLEKEEATQILLKRAGSIQVKEELVEQCLNLCRVRKGGEKGDHYHPLVLNALAESLANYGFYSKQEKMKKWVNSLQSSFCYTDAEAKGEVLQHLLRSTSYNLLSELQKQVFLDIAFYLPIELGVKTEILEWLHLVHGKNVEEAVRILERRGLIDLSGLPSVERLRGRLMHDLYYEMATLIVEEKGSECLFIQGDGLDKHLPLDCKNIKRIRYEKCHFHGDLVMQNFRSLQVLAIVHCRGVKKLDLRGANCLHSLVCFDFLQEERLILGLDECFSLFYLSSFRFSKFSPYFPRNAIAPTFNTQKVYLPELRCLYLDLNGQVFDALDFSSCTHLEYLTLLYCLEHPDLLGLTNLRVFNYFCYYKSDPSPGPVVFHFGHTIESIWIQGCNHVSGLEGLNHNSTSLRELKLDGCEALKVVDGLGELKSLDKLWLIDLGLTAWPRELLKLPKQIQDLQIRRCSFIPAEDTIEVLSTPGLPTHFYLTSISILMELCWDEDHEYYEAARMFLPERMNRVLDPERWKSVLSLLVESKKALDTISKLLLDHFHHIPLLKLVLHLCLGGRYKKLKELLSKAHAVKAFSEAQQPFCLVLLALANQYFGADLESHAFTIANMVAKTCFREGEWYRFQACAAHIAATNACVAQVLPMQERDRISNSANSSYDVITHEILLLEEHYKELYHWALHSRRGKEKAHRGEG